MLYEKLLRLLVVSLYFCRHIHQISVQLKKALVVVCTILFYLSGRCVLPIHLHILVKSHLRRYCHRFMNSHFPEQDLIDACFECVTAEKAQGWFRDCGYLPA